MQTYPSGWEGSAVELLKATGGSAKGKENEEAIGLGRHLPKLQNKLLQHGIKYEKTKTNSGRRYKFYYLNSDAYEGDDQSC